MMAISQLITGGAPPCTCFQIHGARPGFMWESLYQSTSGKRTSIQTGAPAVISWFINHSKYIDYIDTSTINHNYWSYVRQLSVHEQLTGAPPNLPWICPEDDPAMAALAGLGGYVEAGVLILYTHTVGPHECDVNVGLDSPH